MPKQKTNKSAAKRLKVTTKKKIIRSKANRGHLMTGKSQKRVRQLRKKGQVDATVRQTMRRLMPYA